MCPYTAIYVSLHCYMCVLILLYVCPHTAKYVTSYCYIRVLMLPRMCLQTAIYQHVGLWYMCVLILLYMCPIHVSSYCYIYVSSYCYTCECAQAHWTLCVSSYCCMCFLILLYMCLHTATFASALRHTGRESCMRTRIYSMNCYMYALYTCPYIRVLILDSRLYTCPHTGLTQSMYCYIYVSSYCYTCAQAHWT